MKKDKIPNKAILKICIGICCIIIIICAFFIIRYYLSTEMEAIHVEALRTNYVNYVPSSPNVSSDSTSEKAENETQEQLTTSQNMIQYITVDGYPVPYQSIDFTALQENQNTDIYAWITIPNSTIDYPIVQHPTDNNYYLNHNLNGSAGYPGCIYTENYNTTTWADANTIIYGHNMKNGTMFADLHKYADVAFFEEHPYVYIYSDHYVRIYHVFAAYTFSDEHIYTLCDWNNADAVSNYQTEIFNNSGNFDETVALDNSNKLITLSTCIKNQDDKRFLVQGVLVGEGALE